ncbi:MAG: hypothetical protein FWC83_00360 [Alphaproteobacteria bacterium]|nr:hypothetical protein [Alphaproteobacteria bacterium]
MPKPKKEKNRITKKALLRAFEAHAINNVDAPPVGKRGNKWIGVALNKYQFGRKHTLRCARPEEVHFAFVWRQEFKVAGVGDTGFTFNESGEWDDTMREQKLDGFYGAQHTANYGIVSGDTVFVFELYGKMTDKEPFGWWGTQVRGPDGDVKYETINTDVQLIRRPLDKIKRIAALYEKYERAAQSLEKKFFNEISPIIKRP